MRGRIRFYQGSGGLAIREFLSVGVSPKLSEHPLKGGSGRQGRYLFPASRIEPDEFYFFLDSLEASSRNSLRRASTLDIW
jgi:hypothetical protein